LLPASIPAVVITVQIMTNVVEAAREHSRMLPVEQRKVMMVRKATIIVNLGDFLPSKKC
jgi:hypothetical protein